MERQAGQDLDEPSMKISARCIAASSVLVAWQACACGPEGAREILVRQKEARSALVSYGVTVGGREWLPVYVWRETYSRRDGVTRTDYYSTVRGETKGELLASEFDVYRGGKHECAIWTGSDGGLFRLEKSIDPTVLWSKAGQEMVLKGYVVYGADGQVASVNQTVSLRMRKTKTAYFSNFVVDKDARVGRLSAGDELYEEGMMNN